MQGDVTNGVAAEGLGWIKPARRSPERDAVGHVAGPAAFAVLTMVKTADQSEILQVGPAAVRPCDHMMTFAPVRGPVAARERTSEIPRGQGAALPVAGGAAG